MNLHPLLARHLTEVELPYKQYGVYFLMLNDEIVYVGGSNHVTTRINLHISSGKVEFDRAFWIALDKDDVGPYEGAFIRALAPIGCVNTPTDVGRDAEVLARFGMVPNPVAAAEMRARLKARRTGNKTCDVEVDS